MRKVCKVDKCDRHVKGLGYCSKHYQRFKNHGDPLVNKRKKLIQFKIDENGCFNCTSHSSCRGGYKRIHVSKEKHILVHRFVYEQCFGEIPDGLIVRHKCDNPECINPEHLTLGTYKDNMRDKYERNRANNIHGEEIKQAKLKEDDVKEIRFLLSKGVKQIDIARKYNVSDSSIFRIKAGISWVRVKGIKEPEEKGNLLN